MPKTGLTGPDLSHLPALRRATVAVTAAALIIITAGDPASADTGGAQPARTATEYQSKVRFTDKPSKGAPTTINAAYAAARSKRGLGESVRRQFLARSANESGIYYDASYVDYLRFQRSDKAKYGTAELVVPRNYKVKAVELSEGRQRNAAGKLGETVSASVEGTEFSSSTVTLPDGPGFATFRPDGSGQYLLKTSVGELLATWAKQKMSDSGQPNNYFSYQRKGRADTWDISGKDFGIDYFDIQSFPQNQMEHWQDWAPATGKRDGDCSGPAVSLPLTLFGATTSVQYQSCEKHYTTIDADWPGAMSVTWDNGLNYPSGTREIAFNWIIGHPRIGGGLWVNDTQGVAFYRPLDEAYEECRSTNSNECNP